jgi:hypothetical protein
MRCPSCGLLAHGVADDSAPIHCPRCRALQKQVRLLPFEESMRLDDGSKIETTQEHVKP